MFRSTHWESQFLFPSLHSANTPANVASDFFPARKDGCKLSVVHAMGPRASRRDGPAAVTSRTDRRFRPRPCQQYSPAYFRFAFAHLFLWAAPTLARPSALIVLRFLVDIPRLSGAVWPVSSARAFSRRLISALMPCTIAVTSMPVIIGAEPSGITSARAALSAA